jgi:hypothetical protein
MPPLGIAILPLLLTAQPEPPSLREFLERRLEIDEKEWKAIQDGTPVVKLRPGRDSSETRLLGVVKILGSPEDFIERYRDIVAFEKGTGVLQIGRFGEPPRVEDLASLTLDPDDVEDVQKCRPGDCALKMSEDTMNAFQRIDWEAADAVEQANRLARQMIVDFLESYRSGGNRALSLFHDKKTPLLVSQQFEEMMNDPDLPVYFPELFRFLLEYPASPVAGSEEFFYWSKVDFGLKPVIRLNHVVIYRPANDGPLQYTIASKMLYTTHYFNTGVELKFLAVEPSSEGTYYLVAANRSRSDGLTGFTGAIAGGQIRGKARDGLESYLRSVKSRLESRSSARLPASFARAINDDRPARSLDGSADALHGLPHERERVHVIPVSHRGAGLVQRLPGRGHRSAVGFGGARAGDGEGGAHADRGAGNRPGEARREPLDESNLLARDRKRAGFELEGEPRIGDHHDETVGPVPGAMGDAHRGAHGKLGHRGPIPGPGLECGSIGIDRLCGATRSEGGENQEKGVSHVSSSAAVSKISYKGSFRKRSAFAMTETELTVIAALAIIGLRSRPKKGYRTPAARGTPSVL